MPNWRIVAAAAALAAYALMSYALMAFWPDQVWSVAALFGPMLVAVFAGAVSRRHIPTLLGATTLTALLAAVALRGGADVNRLYVLQHAAIHAMLAFAFGVTLRPGSTALITMMALRIHTRFTLAMQVYTRRLTALWVAYFVSMIVLSLALYLLAPWAWWSFFCGVLTPLSAVLFFVGEHFWRYRRHPEFERVTLRRVLQAWRATGTSTPR
jgi:uncharacterized membrane protein